MQPPQPPGGAYRPQQWQPEPPPKAPGSVVAWLVLAFFGCLAELGASGFVLSSRESWAAPTFGAGTVVWLALSLGFRAWLGRRCPHWSGLRRTFVGGYLGFGLLGFLTVLAIALALGLLFGACACMGARR